MFSSSMSQDLIGYSFFSQVPQTNDEDNSYQKERFWKVAEQNEQRTEDLKLKISSCLVFCLNTYFSVLKKNTHKKNSTN